MMRVPGRKDSGVIFTTVTELPPKERLERSDRERPSGSGLQRSKDETASSDREREEVEIQEGGGQKGNGDTRKHSKMVVIEKKKRKENRYEV